MPTSTPSTLKRPIHKIPKYVREALAKRGLMEAYRSRPAYQQNDYIGWITSAKLRTTQDKRLDQMLDELAGGTKYMNMAYKPQRTKRASDKE
jgi:uncharacterized protein YdeI (YjbR/CyaY-like superfamily)